MLCYCLALLKQQGVGLKGLSKSTPVSEDIPPLLEGGGKLEVCSCPLTCYAVNLLNLIGYFQSNSLSSCNNRFGTLMVSRRLLYPKMMSENSILGTAIWSFIPTILVKGKKTTSCAVGLERIVFR